ncbi:MAG: helix-turn-helix transcriptional regulator [Bryobacteraceae bacterium]
MPLSASEVEKRLFLLALEVALPWLRNESGRGNAIAKWHTERVLELIGERNGRLSLADLGSELGKATDHLGRLFARRTGTTLPRYSLCMRMTKAAALLRDPERSVKEVAGSVGYADTRNFDRQFCRTLGIAPGGFRERFCRPGRP